MVFVTLLSRRIESLRNLRSLSNVVSTPNLDRAAFRRDAACLVQTRLQGYEAMDLLNDSIKDIVSFEGAVDDVKNSKTKTQHPHQKPHHGPPRSTRSEVSLR